MASVTLYSAKLYSNLGIDENNRFKLNLLTASHEMPRTRSFSTWASTHPKRAMVTLFSSGFVTATLMLTYLYVPAQQLAADHQITDLKRHLQSLNATVSAQNEKINELTIPPRSSITVEEIEKGHRLRSGRGGEQIAFLQKFVGEQINWKVVLYNKISENFWTFEYPSGDHLYTTDAIFGVTFDKDSEKAATSLHSGDQIQLKGILQPFSGSELKVDGATFDFLAPASEK
jgi:hypothetical protein